MKIQASLNEVEAANNFAKAAANIRKQKELDVEIEIKRAKAVATERWDGHLGDGWTYIAGGQEAGIPDLILSNK